MSSKASDKKDDIQNLNVMGESKVGSKKSSIKSKNMSRQQSDVQSQDMKGDEIITEEEQSMLMADHQRNLVNQFCRDYALENGYDFKDDQNAMVQDQD